MEGAGGGSPLSMLLPFVLIFAVFYFIVIMPAKKQQKKKDAMIAGLKKGDRIVTSGGIHGRITGVSDTTLTVEISDKVRVKVARGNVGTLVQSPSQGQQSGKKKDGPVKPK